MSKELVSTLRRGGIAVIPTDTVYGVVASARDRHAVARLYRLRRKEQKPFIILIRSLRDLSSFGVTIGVAGRCFLRAIWPGKVSVVLPCAGKKYSYLHLGTHALAFRIPRGRSIQTLLSHAGPLVAPSANPPGKKPAATRAEARKYFGKKVDLYVGRGRRSGKPSTLVLCEGSSLTVLREGSVRGSVLHRRFKKCYTSCK